MINIALVEDEEKFAVDISSHVKRYMEENNYEYRFKWFPSGESFLFSDVNEYDIILMDIQLPKIDGISVIKRVRETNQEVAVIFVTSLYQYAIRGYEVSAIDFMVKPVNYYNFALKFRRAVNYVLRNVNENVVVRNKNETNVIKIHNIIYVESVGHKILYHTTQGIFQTSGTLKKVAESLRKFPFSLCNQCYLVNLRHVTASDGDSVKVGEEKLAMSRTRRKDFMRDLNQYLADNAYKG